MARPLVSATAAVIVLALVLLIPGPAFADGDVNILDVLMYTNEDMGMTCTNPPPD